MYNQPSQALVTKRNNSRIERYRRATQSQQTACLPLPRMQPINKAQAATGTTMNEQIQQAFIAAAREYFFGRKTGMVC